MKEVKRLIRCAHGHFFDGGKYDECPHCNNTKVPDVTVFVGDTVKEEDFIKKGVAEETKGREKADIKQMAEKETKNTSKDFFSDSQKEAVAIKEQKNADNYTVHYFQKAIGTEPVVGWLVCVKGVHFGEDFKIKSGRNFIGRSGNMNISLSADKAISRDKHAILTYDPKSNSFLIQPGESSELCYVNDEAILVPTKLKINDRISLGESELVFIPFCSDTFTWEKEKNNN